ncbi:MAG: alpha-amylase family glycosyl hydrolase, partial [Candidatus Cryptobacteroides sp.]
MNVRQYTAEGNFQAAAKQLPRLKELGVDIVWLMPIYEIGQKERKGSLGSYYAIRDYTSVNPEFGDYADFDHFVSEAHALGLKVILDFVANHTSPDCPWVSEKPADWYLRDSLGNTLVEYDWTDIAKLNYENADMRAAVQDAMRFWLDRGVDGFRCDMAFLVPQDFWTETISALRSEYRQ